MSNPFHGDLDDHFRGERVRVVSNDGRTFVGWCKRVHHHARHVVLRDAKLLRDDGSHDELGPAMVAHADSIEVLESTSRITRVRLDDVQDSPYHAAEFDASENRRYIDTVRRDGWVGSFPTVREVRVDDGGLEDTAFEIVEGHKRIWAAREAGLSKHQVEIVDVDDWTATRTFVHDHIPGPHHVDAGERHDSWYSDDEIEAAIEAIFDEWGDRALEIERVAWNADRLGLSIEAGEVRLADDDQEESVSADDEDLVFVSSGHKNVFHRDEGCERLQRSASTHHKPRSRLKEDIDECSVCGEGVDEAAEDGDDDRDEEPSEDDDLSRRAREVLGILEDGGEQLSGEIAEKIEASRGSVHNYLRELTEAGLVDRRKDPVDGRRKLYRPAGTEPDTSRKGGEEAEDEDEPDDHGEDGGDEEGESDTQEDDESDAAEDEGSEEPPEIEPDVEQSSSDSEQGGYQYDCACGATFDNSLEYRIHRTEDHGVTLADLNTLEPGEFESVVNQAESVQEIADQVGCSLERVLRMLNVYGIEDVVGPSDVEISDLNDWEFDGVVDDDRPADAGEFWCGYCGAGPRDTEEGVRDHHDQEGHPGQPVVKTEDPSDGRAEGEPAPSLPDGGPAVAGAGIDGGPSRTCQNCESQVTAAYARVHAPEDQEDIGPRVCPNCEDMVREGNSVREARSTRHNGGGSA